MWVVYPFSENTRLKNAFTTHLTTSPHKVDPLFPQKHCATCTPGCTPETVFCPVRCGPSHVISDFCLCNHPCSLPAITTHSRSIIIIYSSKSFLYPFDFVVFLSIASQCSVPQLSRTTTPPNLVSTAPCAYPQFFCLLNWCFQPQFSKHCCLLLILHPVVRCDQSPH